MVGRLRPVGWIEAEHLAEDTAGELIRQRLNSMTTCNFQVGSHIATRSCSFLLFLSVIRNVMLARSRTTLHELKLLPAAGCHPALDLILL